jgi:plasmid maintenance system antidote protein VapI
MRSAQRAFPFDAAFHAICKKEKVSQMKAADRLKISPQRLCDVLAGRKRLSIPLALRFEKHFGLDALTLLLWQLEEDVKEARRGS